MSPSSRASPRIRPSPPRTRPLPLRDGLTDTVETRKGERSQPITHNGRVTDLDAFTALFTDEGAALLASLREYDPAQELAVATRLRRSYPTELVSAALAQARLRQRAVPKFGADDAYRMFFTPNGVEQSTRKSVADHRARRFAELGVRSVADLCCGVGGDALALARAGISVLAVDRDPLTAEVVRANADALGLSSLIEVRCADVAEVGTDPYDAVFVDPARRGGRGRIFNPEAYSPPLSWATGAVADRPESARHPGEQREQREQREPSRSLRVSRTR